MVPTALLQRRLPDMAAQRYVKYRRYRRYGTYGIIEVHIVPYVPRVPNEDDALSECHRIKAA